MEFSTSAYVIMVISMDIESPLIWDIATPRRAAEVEDRRPTARIARPTAMKPCKRTKKERTISGRGSKA